MEFTNVKPDDSEWSELKKIEERSLERANQAKNLQNELTNKLVSKELPAAVVERKPLGTPELSSKIETKSEPPVIKRNKPKTELEMKIIDAQNEHPSKKKDIFKAIFDSDSEGSGDEDEVEENSGISIISKPPTINADLMATLTRPSTSSSAIYAQLPDEAFKPKSAREINILRNTSPPRGIFSGLIKKTESTTKVSDSIDSKSSEKITLEDDEEDTNAYGPSLPPMKSSHNGNSDTSIASKSNPSAVTSISLGKTKVIYEEKWIEKSDEKEKKSKKEKKHKKDRDRHKSKKEKKEKHKKKKR